MDANGIGIYAEQMMRNHPLLPVEEEGRLGDPTAGKLYPACVCVVSLETMLAEGLTPRS